MVEPLEGWDEAFTARLERWVADARIGAAALQRSRERWLREVAEQEATLAGVLIDLAERRTPVSVQTRGSGSHQGLIRVIGADFVGLELRSHAEVLVAMGAIALVRTAPTVDATAGDRMIGTDLRLADVLAELAADRAHVALTVAQHAHAAHTVVGQLRSVGHDVATVHPDAEQRSNVYVALAAVTEILIA